MANVIIIAGDTSTGKSSSLRTLNPEETFINKSINKPLPWKGSGGQYIVEKKNTSYIVDSNTLLALFSNINSAAHIKNLILDDIGFIMTNEFFERSSESGFGKFSDIGKHMQALLKKAQTMRDDLNIIFVFHTDTESNDQFGKEMKIKTIGRLLEDKYNPAAIVSVCLFTKIDYAADGSACYKFITNRRMMNGIEIPAKSPDGMFEELLIPNDMAYVINKINEYYLG